jgi:hypothetical protein|tara:strand:- start:840 stop:1022 length:183 start_codon:yes stop_codon:yes gene_type:complete
MDNKEIRLEILKVVLESGSENIKSNPLPKCEEYYKWISMISENLSKKSKTTRKNLTDNKE